MNEPRANKSRITRTFRIQRNNRVPPRDNSDDNGSRRRLGPQPLPLPRPHPSRLAPTTCAKSQSSATGAPRSASTAPPASPSTAPRGSPSIPQNSTSTSPRRPTAPTTSSSSPQISPAPAAARPASSPTTSFIPTRREPGFCTAATGPAVYWSYNTNLNATGGKTTGTIATSPILSADGTKVAFIENNGGAGAVLHLLKWKAGDGGAIGTAINPTTTTAWTSCPATGACMISITFANASADTGSSPFYDYTHDALYVGDDLSVLHKFINVFGITGATPSEVTTGGWPFTVDTTVRDLNSPVLDGASGNIFVDDLNGTLSYVRETFSTVGTCKTGSPPCIGSTTVVPSQVHSLIDAPIVDSSTQKVFVFYANYDGTNMAVVQSDTALSAKVSTTAGSKLNQRHMHAGAFDNTYLSGTGNTGRLYLCGGSATGQPTLMRVGFNNTATTFPNATGTMNTTVDATPTLQVVSTLNAVDCGPLTEFFNANAPAANQDQLFFGVAGDSTSANLHCSRRRLRHVRQHHQHSRDAHHRLVHPRNHGRQRHHRRQQLHVRPSLQPLLLQPRQQHRPPSSAEQRNTDRRRLRHQSHPVRPELIFLEIARNQRLLRKALLVVKQFGVIDRGPFKHLPALHGNFAYTPASLASRCRTSSNLSCNATLTATVMLSPVNFASFRANRLASGFLMFSRFADFLIFLAMKNQHSSIFVALRTRPSPRQLAILPVTRHHHRANSVDLKYVSIRYPAT